MFEHLGCIVKESRLYFLARNIYYDYKDINYKFDKLIRSIGNNKKYSKLSSLKNKYTGERCFIVATGPSLTISDLEKIEGEYSFACNSIVSAYSSTQWRPTFYGVQDVGVFEKVKNSIKTNDYDYIFVSSLIKDKSMDETVVRYPLNLMGHTVALFNNNIEKVKYGFSENCALEVTDGFSITYSLFQLAIYMGFREIYFLGQDCNYNSNPEKQHFMGDKSSQKFNPHWQQTGKLICNAFEASKKYCEDNGIKVFNTTRGGMFEVFPRVELEEVIR